jgi:hypothetical protein
VYELSNLAAGWNWTSEPSVFPLLGKAVVGTSTAELRWKYQSGTLDVSDGQRVTLRFVCDQPALELVSQWWARPGRGPVRHSMTIHNRASEPVTLFEQPTMHLSLNAPSDQTLAMWRFHTDGGRPDSVGVYCDAVVPPFYHAIRTEPNGKFIPYTVFDAGGEQGLYVGIEWSYCRIAAAAAEGTPAGTFQVRGGEFAEFKIEVAPGDTFEVPPGFVGVYQGDVDDAGNGLRRYLLQYHTPEVVRRDPGYPKVQWNAFGATGKQPGSWDSVESKYYPLVDDIAPLGFEEVMLDVGWWKGPTRFPEQQPEADPEDWPSGMAKAAEHAHQAGMRFGLYWNKGEDMATAEGRARRGRDVKRLYVEHQADLWRSDNTGGAGGRRRLRVGQGFLRLAGPTGPRHSELPMGELFQRRTDQGLRRDAAGGQDLHHGHLLRTGCAAGVLRQLVCLSASAVGRLRRQGSAPRSCRDAVCFSLRVDGGAGVVRRRTKRAERWSGLDRRGKGRGRDGRRHV